MRFSYSTMMWRKTCPALLWGLCVSFVVESVSVPTPENGTNNQTMPWTTADNKEETRAATWTQSHKSAEVSVATATAVSRMSPTEETEKNHLTTNTSRINTVGLTAASTPSVQLSHGSTEATTTERTAPSTQETTISEGVKQTEDQHQQSATALTSTASPATSSTALSPVTFFTRPTAVTELKNSSELSSTTSSNSEPPIFVSDYSTPSVPTSSTGTINPTSEAAATFKTISSSSEVTETHISTELSRVSLSSSTTSSPISSSQSAASSSSADTFLSTGAPSSTTAFSTSSAAILIPLDPRKLPNPQTKPPPANSAAPRDISKSAADTEVQTCSTRSVVKHCLIVIACLALLATIFIVSTIVLCTKLSAKRYRVKKSQEGTEMMCISALLPERTYSYRRQNNPVTNGVLVFPRAGDSDEDGGDNVTLSSFLPDNDRYV